MPSIFSSKGFIWSCRNYHLLIRLWPLRCSSGRFSSLTFQPPFDLDLLKNTKFVEELRHNVKARQSDFDVDKLLDFFRRYQSGDQSIRNDLMSLISRIPNRTHPSTPIGDESRARQIYVHGTKRPAILGAIDAVQFTSPQRTYPALSEKSPNFVSPDILYPYCHLRTKNLTCGSGPRSYYFGGDLALLESALIRYTLDHLRDAGFALVSVPDILPEPVIQACGFPTRGVRSQVYQITPSTQNLTYCLSGTSEMGLAGFCSGRSFHDPDDPQDLSDSSSTAVGLCAVSRCYRQEVTHRDLALYRVHQFTKVEMFGLTPPIVSASEAMFDKIVKLQICLFADLDLHFRVLEMPSEELGDPAHRKIDIEAWMPSTQTYGEISSASICLDYQSKRLNIQWPTKEDPNAFCYTLNGTACAIPRMIKALIETHQNKDGTVKLPKALHPYIEQERGCASQFPVVRLKRSR